MSATRQLTEDDRRAISDAIARAEAGTSGEIYCIVARTSADYREVPIAWGVLAALVLPLLAVALGWTPASPSGWVAQADGIDVVGAIVLFAAAQALLFAGVCLLAALPAVRGRLTPGALKRARVRRAAVELFLARGLQATEARTGVLIYASLAERRVEVLADETIHRQVDPDVWGAAAAALTTHLARGETAAGFLEAIELCGGVLAERFPPRPGDVNELRDHLAEI